MENQNGLSVKSAAHESKWEIRCGNAESLFSSWPKEVTLIRQNTSICAQGWSVQERAFGCYQLVSLQPFLTLWEEKSWGMVGLIMRRLEALSAEWAGILRKWRVYMCLHPGTATFGDLFLPLSNAVKQRNALSFVLVHHSQCSSASLNLKCKVRNLSGPIPPCSAMYRVRQRKIGTIVWNIVSVLTVHHQPGGSSERILVPSETCETLHKFTQPQ